MDPLVSAGLDYISFGLLIVVMGQLAIGMWLLIALRSHRARDAKYAAVQRGWEYSHRKLS